MPAPTALLQAAQEPAVAALPEHDDDELILDVNETNLTDATAILPPADDNEMQVDEEGRPRFAPGKDIVRFTRAAITGEEG